MCVCVCVCVYVCVCVGLYMCVGAMQLVEFPIVLCLGYV